MNRGIGRVAASWFSQRATSGRALCTAQIARVGGRVSGPQYPGIADRGVMIRPCGLIIAGGQQVVIDLLHAGRLRPVI